MLPTQNPDIIIEHKPDFCSGCGSSLQTELSYFLEERQELEIPPVQAQYIAHRLYYCKCPQCHTETYGQFPNHIKEPVQSAINYLREDFPTLNT